MAEDAGGAETAGPWIRPSSMEEQYPQPMLDLMGWDADAWKGAAPPEYPCLVDERHQLALLYGMVNVPTAVWIDEDGRIVRPPEPAAVTEAFKAIDLASFSMPPDAVETTIAGHRAAQYWVLKPTYHNSYWYYSCMVVFKTSYGVLQQALFYSTIYSNPDVDCMSTNMQRANDLAPYYKF